MQEQPWHSSYSSGGKSHSAFSSAKARALHPRPVSRMGAACSLPLHGERQNPLAMAADNLPELLEEGAG